MCLSPQLVHFFSSYENNLTKADSDQSRPLLRNLVMPQFLSHDIAWKFQGPPKVAPLHLSNLLSFVSLHCVPWLFSLYKPLC